MGIEVSVFQKEERRQDDEAMGNIQGAVYMRSWEQASKRSHGLHWIKNIRLLYIPMFMLSTIYGVTSYYYLLQLIVEVIVVVLVHVDTGDTQTRGPNKQFHK